jgi:hypothetical protein
MEEVSAMSSLVQRDKDVARRKGMVAGAATVGSVALIAVGAPWLGVIGLIPAAYLVKDWFTFRAKRGMRF